ncbi:Aste57867_1456 [Aphanomyces stellatus]|uniref:Aste57867_1456 protein n=1 Tax=Aphanomyces stellatus TaxID=120398 RepID=A0A485KAD2_9STRA|nr:hypothetical protein As57867_001455 [Aphanomyces stellatus]VFT78673.1 Aste57867_1456 [Aphanomyces stellatus]
MSLTPPSRSSPSGSPSMYRPRGRCIVDNCENQIYARQRCCKHGAKKPCAVHGCALRARHNGVCFAHGAPKKQCAEPGCPKPAQARQKCVKHGGGRTCKFHGCISHARSGGYCQRHRGPEDDQFQNVPFPTSKEGVYMAPPEVGNMARNGSHTYRRSGSNDDITNFKVHFRLESRFEPPSVMPIKWSVEPRYALPDDVPRDLLEMLQDL